MTSIIEHLRVRMKKLGIKQDTLAAKMGISRISLNRFLNGHTGLRYDKFLIACDALNIRLDFSAEEESCQKSE